MRPLGTINGKVRLGIYLPYILACLTKQKQNIIFWSQIHDACEDGNEKKSYLTVTIINQVCHPPMRTTFDNKQKENFDLF